MSTSPRRVRLVALGGVLTLAASGLLAGCGGSSSSDDAVSSAKQSADAVATQAADAADTVASAADSVASAAAGAVDADNHTIVVEVTSATATSADITVTSLDANGSISQEQKTAEPLPFTKTIEIDGAITFDASNANVLAQIKDGEDVTASIKVDDQAPVTSSSSGQFATVMVAGAAK